MENVLLWATGWKTQQSLALQISLNFQLADICESASETRFNINPPCRMFRCNNSFSPLSSHTSILIPIFRPITFHTVAFLELKFRNSTASSCITQVEVSKLLFLPIIYSAATWKSWADLQAKRHKYSFCLCERLIHLTKSVRRISDVSIIYIKFQTLHIKF